MCIYVYVYQHLNAILWSARGIKENGHAEDPNAFHGDAVDAVDATDATADATAVEAPKEVAEEAPEAPKVTENGTAIIEDDDEEANCLGAWTYGKKYEVWKMLKHFETMEHEIFGENMSLEVWSHVFLAKITRYPLVN